MSGCLLLLLLLLEGCGRKGPLFMQQQPPNSAPVAKQSEAVQSVKSPPETMK